MQWAMPTTWAKGEGAWTEFLKKHCLYARRKLVGPAYTKGGQRDRTWRFLVCLFGGRDCSGVWPCLCSPSMAPHPHPLPHLNPGGRGCSGARPCLKPHTMASPIKHIAQGRRLQRSPPCVSESNMAPQANPNGSSNQSLTRLAVLSWPFLPGCLHLSGTYTKPISSPSWGLWEIKKKPHPFLPKHPWDEVHTPPPKEPIKGGWEGNHE